MNAEKWHEDTTKGESPPSAKGESPPPLMSVWARAGESTEFAAHLRQAEAEASQRPEPAPDDEPDSQETRATLLRAIENTDVAAHLRQLESEAGQPSSQPASRALTPTPETRPAATEKAPAGTPLSPSAPNDEPDSQEARATLLRAIENTDFAARLRQLESEAGQPSPQPASRVLTPTPETKPAAAEKAPAGTPLSPSAPVEDHSSGASFLARLKGEIRFLAPKLAASARALYSLSAPRPRDQRRSQRLVSPPLVAYYWTGGAPSPQVVADISSSGLYLATHDRWLPRTVISMALQRTDQESGTPGSWIAVDVMVVRLGGDGIGGAFLPSMPGLADAAARRLGNVGDKEAKRAKKALERFVEHLTVSTNL